MPTAIAATNRTISSQPHHGRPESLSSAGAFAFTVVCFVTCAGDAGLVTVLVVVFVLGGAAG
jgi:hypothetical protein